MFKSAVFKLTAWYVGALVIACAVFSIPLFLAASTRLERGANAQFQIVQGQGFSANGSPFSVNFDDFLEARQKRLDEDRRNLLLNIIVIDLIIIALGSSLSYWFADRTLRPIRKMHDALGRFTSDASHELRTPLAVMQTEIDVALRDKKATGKELREVLESNLEEVMRLRGLSEQLLSLTRLDANGIDMHPVDLTRLMKNQISDIEKRHGTTFKTSLESKVKVTGNSDLLAQTISIISENAIKYSNGSKKPITWTLKKHGGDAVLTCEDHGVGIDEDDLGHIFERFYRGKQASGKAISGHGLGLAIAQEIISKHNGGISITSNKGKGTAVRITLPAT